VASVQVVGLGQPFTPFSLVALTRDRVYETLCLCQVTVYLPAYTPAMPKLWSETVEAHRHRVRDAILDATVALAEEHGLLSVTMSQIAEETGIGRATLYKYFPDVQAILLAWHEREITGHFELLANIRDRASNAGERLAAVLEGYALVAHEFRGHADADIAALLHRDVHVGRAEHRLRAMLGDLLVEAAEAGDVRDDVAPDELASYCLHALTASNRLASKAAVRRLVAVTLDGLRPPR
jgi:AcrR family transcriptional regulator